VYRNSRYACNADPQSRLTATKISKRRRGAANLGGEPALQPAHRQECRPRVCANKSLCRSSNFRDGQPMTGDQTFCNTCGHHEHPTAGTIFHKSTTSLTTWFYAIYLMSSTREASGSLLNGVSAACTTRSARNICRATLTSTRSAITAATAGI